MFTNALTLSSLLYDTINVMDDEKIVFTLEAILICMFQNWLQRRTKDRSCDSNSERGITPTKTMRTNCHTILNEIYIMVHPLLSWRLRTNDHNLCYRWLAHPVQTQCLLAQCWERATSEHKCSPHIFGRQVSSMRTKHEAYECVCNNVMKMILSKLYQ